MKNGIIKDGVSYEHYKGTAPGEPFRVCALCHLKRISCREACRLFYTGEWGYFTNADHSQVTSAMSDEDILFITLVGLDKAKDIPTNTGTVADAAKSYIGVLKNLISEHMKEKGDRQRTSEEINAIKAQVNEDTYELAYQDAMDSVCDWIMKNAQKFCLESGIDEYGMILDLKQAMKGE